MPKQNLFFDTFGNLRRGIVCVGVRADFESSSEAVRIYLQRCYFQNSGDVLACFRVHQNKSRKLVFVRIIPRLYTLGSSMMDFCGDINNECICARTRTKRLIGFYSSRDGKPLDLVEKPSPNNFRVKRLSGDSLVQTHCETSLEQRQYHTSTVYLLKDRHWLQKCVGEPLIDVQAFFNGGLAPKLSFVGAALSHYPTLSPVTIDKLFQSISTKVLYVDEKQILVHTTDSPDHFTMCPNVNVYQGYLLYSSRVGRVFVVVLQLRKMLNDEHEPAVCIRVKVSIRIIWRDLDTCESREAILDDGDCGFEFSVLPPQVNVNPATLNVYFFTIRRSFVVRYHNHNLRQNEKAVYNILRDSLNQKNSSFPTPVLDICWNYACPPLKVELHRELQHPCHRSALVLAGEDYAIFSTQ